MTSNQRTHGQSPERKHKDASIMKGEDKNQAEYLDQDSSNYEFMRPLAEHKHLEAANKNIPKVNKSIVLSPQEVEKSLREIYRFYAKAYERPQRKESLAFAELNSEKIVMQSYLLFCKNFHILKAIFTIEKLTTLFKKHADYGKYLTFDNFNFMINSMSHEEEAKQFFHLQQMIKNLDIQTAQQLERQEFYNYLQLGSPQRYRQNFTELFRPFNMPESITRIKMQYNYRKFSLPQLRKKALPEPKQKKHEKDLFILKHDKSLQQNQFDQVKSIVVSWDSLRAKSVNNLVERKYLRIDPEKDPFLEYMRSSSRQSPKDHIKSKINQLSKGNQIDKKIKQIEKSEQAKNQKLLERIEKKLNIKSDRKLQL